MRETSGRNKKQVEEVGKFATENKVDLRTVELDVLSEASANAAIQKIIEDNGRSDVLIHNAGHMVFGPAEAFTPEQLAELYDVNLLSTQRVNRAALPQLRKQRNGLLVWISSSSAAGGTPPYLAPYFAAKAGMDALAVAYARELTRWGIETSIIVPGAFTSGTNHFAHAGSPADKARPAEYEAGPYKSFGEEMDVSLVAEAIVRVVDTPFGKRPFRVHVDPTQDGAEVVNAVSDRVRAEMLWRVGLEDLLKPERGFSYRRRPMTVEMAVPANPCPLHCKDKRGEDVRYGLSYFLSERCRLGLIWKNDGLYRQMSAKSCSRIDQVFCQCTRRQSVKTFGALVKAGIPSVMLYGRIKRKEKSFELAG
jgi:NAD(P)-dependent dehydrogenase (short-subunit alcohol dehydrogenase family)